MTLFDIRQPRVPSGRETMFYLLRGRAAYRVFQALSDLYDSDDAVNELANDENLQAALDNVAVLCAQIQREIVALGPNFSTESYLETVQEQYPNLLESVSAVADELGVSPHDLLSVLINA